MNKNILPMLMLPLLMGGLPKKNEPDELENIDLQSEYALIVAKKSCLSARHRHMVVARWERLQGLAKKKTP